MGAQQRDNWEIRPPSLWLGVLVLCWAALAGCGNPFGSSKIKPADADTGAVAVAEVAGQFAGTTGNVSSSGGSCSVTGTGNGWCAGGTYVAGAIDGGFNFISSVAVSGNYLFVVDRGNNRVSRLDRGTGVFSGAIGRLSANSGNCPTSGAAGTWCSGGTFTSGSADGMFNNARGMAASADGFLYVADTLNNRVQKIQISNGASLGSIGRITSGTGSCSGSGAVPGWCTNGVFAAGAGDGMFNNPYGIAIDPAQDILYVSDYNNHRVQKFTRSTGAFLGSIGMASANSGNCPASGVAPGWCTGGTFGSGAVDGAFNGPYALAADGTYLYVSDQNNHRVQRILVSTGEFAGAIGRSNASGGTCVSSGAANSSWCTGGTFLAGGGDGMLNGPRDLVVHRAARRLYVVDNINHRLVKLNLDSGAFLGAIGGTSASSGTCPNSGVAPAWCTGGTFGSGTTDGTFNGPGGIDLDSEGLYLYVGQNTSAKVQRIR